MDRRSVLMKRNHTILFATDEEKDSQESEQNEYADSVPYTINMPNVR